MRGGADVVLGTELLLALVVDDPGGELESVRGIDAVDEVGPRLIDLAGRDDVLDRVRVAEKAVQPRVHESGRLARELVGSRDHTGEQRRGQAGAADPVLVVVHPVGKRLRPAFEESGCRVGIHRDVGHDPHRLIAEDRAVGSGQAGVGSRQRLRHDALLVEGLRVDEARPAAGATVESEVDGEPLVQLRRIASAGVDEVLVALKAAGRRPAVLAGPLTVAADRQARSSHRRGPRARGGVVGCHESEGRELVAVVAAGEQDADAGAGRHLEDVVGGDPVARIVEHVAAVVAVGVRDDLGQVAVDDLLDLTIERVGEAALRAHVEDVRTRSRRVHGLNVEGLLAKPTGGATGVDLVELVGRQLGELRRRHGVRRVVARGIGLEVRRQRRRRVGVDDRHSHAGPVGGAVEAVGAAHLRRGVAAHRPRRVRRVALAKGRQRAVELLTVEAPARRGDTEAGRLRDRPRRVRLTPRAAGRDVGGAVALRERLADARDPGDNVGEVRRNREVLVGQTKLLAVDAVLGQ